MRIKTKRKAIIGYIVNWIAIIVFGFFAYIAYKAVFNNLFIDSESSFYLGVVFGMALVTFWILFISAIMPVVKYVIVKIHRSPLSFIDILIIK